MVVRLDEGSTCANLANKNILLCCIISRQSGWFDHAARSEWNVRTWQSIISVISGRNWV